MTTQEIIDFLKLHQVQFPLSAATYKAAADRLEELQRLNDSMQVDRDLWIKVGREKLEATENERNEARAEVERLKETAAAYEQATVKQSLTVRLDPSRLEIAAMLKAGWFANRDADFNATDHKWWIEQADALIAAAKEGK